MNNLNYTTIEPLIGKTFTEVFNHEGEELIFKGESSYKFYHEQDCCESVMIEEIYGDLSDLMDTPIIVAEEASRQERDGEYGDSQTWTFYNFRTIKGTVTVRWRGSSNGYYSESVDFKEITE